LSVYSAVALIPLPSALVGWAMPRTIQFWSDQAVAAPSFVPISLDRAATALEVVKWAFYALVALLAHGVARARGLGTILLLIGGLALFTALLSLGHLLVNAEHFMGLYRPISAARAVGPLLNPNHLAALVNLGTFAWLGLWIGRTKSKVPRGVILLGVLACALTAIVSASRGGVASLLISGSLLLCFLARRRVPRWALFGPALLFFGGIGLGFLSLSDDASADLFGKDVNKLKVLVELGPLIADSAWLGVGRGAFDSVSQFYLGNTWGVVFRSVECFPLHWLVEWGIPGGGTALIALGFLLWPWRLTVGGSLRASSAYFGLVAVLLQNLLDIGLELPGVAAPFWALLGGLEGSRQERSGSFSLEAVSPKLGRLQMPAVLAGVLAVGLGLAFALGPSVFESRLRAHQLFVGVDEMAFRRSMERDVRRFPSEPYFWQLLALREASLGHDFLEPAARSLGRAPRSGRAHLLVAEALQRRGALRQALRHLAWAVENDLSLASQSASLARSWTSDAGLLELAMPARNSARFLVHLAQSLEDRKFAVLRRSYLERAVRAAPREPEPQAALAFELLSDLTSGSQPCASVSEGTELQPQGGPSGGRCPLGKLAPLEARVEGMAHLLTELEPERCRAVQLSAGLLVVRSNAGAAEALLRERCSGCVDALGCFRDRIAKADAVGDSNLVRNAETAYSAEACSSEPECRRALGWLGERALARRDWSEARRHYKLAANYEPALETWLGLFRAELELGEFEGAEQALKKARELSRVDPSLEAALRSAREAALRQMLRP